MKKTFISLVTLLAFALQSFTPMPGMVPVYLRVKKPPLNGGLQGPSKSPGIDLVPTISVYMNETADSLLLYTASEETCSYNICNENELEVGCGNLVFSEQGEASVSIGTLAEGTYTISIEVDSLVFEGEFEKE